MGVRVRTLVVLFRGEARDLKNTIEGIGKAKTPLEKLEKTGRAAFMTLSAGALGVAGGLAFSAKAFGDFDAALNESIAIMGDVSDGMRKQMGDAAREVALQTTFSAKEAAEAFYYLASSGMTAEQSIKALPQVAQFAQAGMFDLETATDLLVNSQIALGLQSDDASQNLINLKRVSDVLTEANNEATGSVQDFAEALTNKAATAMKTMNISVEEGVAVLAAFAQKGVKGNVAGEKLAIFLRDTARAAVRNKDAFADMGVEVFDQQGNMKDLAEVVRQFEQALGPLSDSERAAALENMGMTRSVGDIIRTLMGSSDAIATYEENLRNAGGTTEEVADKQLQTFNAQMTLLKNRLMDVAIEIGSRLVPKLMPIVIWLQENMPRAIEYAQQVFESMRPTLEAIARFIADHVLPVLKDLATWFEDHPAAIAAAMGVVLTVLVALAAGFVALKIQAAASIVMVVVELAVLAAQAIATGVAMAVAWIIGLGPIALIVAAVVALGVLIYVFRDQIMDALNAAWKWIKDTTAPLFEWIGDHWRILLFFMTGGLSLFVGFFVTQWSHIAAFFANIFHFFKEVTEDFWFFIQGVWNVITIAGVYTWHAIYAAAAFVLGWIADRTEGVRKWIGDAFTWLKDHIIGAWNAVSLWAGIAWDAIKDKVASVVDWIGDKIDWVKDKLNSIPGAGVLKDALGFVGIGGQSGMVVPSYQIGGIAGDTIPAMLKPGEMVLNRRQQQTLFDSLNRGGWNGGGGGDTYVVEVNNPIIASQEQFDRMVVNSIKRAGGQGRPITIRGRQL